MPAEPWTHADSICSVGGEFGHLYRPLVLQEVSSEQPALVAREGPVVELLRV
jgi:uncharacterized protein (DUF952 family)